MEKVLSFFIKVLWISLSSLFPFTVYVDEHDVMFFKVLPSKQIKTARWKRFELCRSYQGIFFKQETGRASKTLNHFIISMLRLRSVFSTEPPWPCLLMLDLRNWIKHNWARNLTFDGMTLTLVSSFVEISGTRLFLSVH